MRNIAAGFAEEIQQFKKSVRQYIRSQGDEEITTDPYIEYEIWIRYKRYGVMPVEGGLLAQPHILLLAFDIIENELREWEKVQEINRKRIARWQQEQMKKHAGTQTTSGILRDHP